MDRTATEVFGIPSICLMENAGAGAARHALQMISDGSGPVVIACGPGNNGGDGLVVARHLALAGTPVLIAQLASRSGRTPTGDAGIQFEIARAMELPSLAYPDDEARLPAAPSLVVDALFGTGLDRALDGPAAALVEWINGVGAPVLALDLPSGLDCDTGRPLGPCVRADVTVTFVAPKTGFRAQGASSFTGEVRVVGIGAPLEWPR